MSQQFYKTPQNRAEAVPQPSQMLNYRMTDTHHASKPSLFSMDSEKQLVQDRRSRERLRQVRSSMLNTRPNKAPLNQMKLSESNRVLPSSTNSVLIAPQSPTTPGIQHKLS